MAKNILITGASGLLGSRLSTMLVQKGYQVSHLSRSAKEGPIKTYEWDIDKGRLEPQALKDCDAIIHLAGAGIADKRWTASRKREILESRTKSTDLLYQSLKKIDHQVQSFISASAIGYYGFGGDDVVFDEEILQRLLAGVDGNYLCIDRNIQLDAEEVKVSLADGSRVALVSKSLAPAEAIGESIGIELINASTSDILFAELRAMMDDPANLQDYYEAAYERLIADGFVFHAVDITGLAWAEIDTRQDYDLANELFC